METRRDIGLVFLQLSNFFINTNRISEILHITINYFHWLIKRKMGWIIDSNNLDSTRPVQGYNYKIYINENTIIYVKIVQ